MSDIIGKVSDNRSKMEIEWRIADFFSLSGRSYRSPSFFCFSESRHLRIYPNGFRENTSGWIVFLFVYCDLNSPPTLAHTLGVKTADGRKATETDFTHVFDRKDEGGETYFFLSRAELRQRKSELAPSDVLTLTCSLRRADSIVLGSKKAREDRGGVEASTQTEPGHGIEKLSRDLNGLMLSGHDSDLTVRVKGEDFRLHRGILGARTPVFHAMFKHQMSEKTTGIVSIDDCEADTFRAFLHYVYTGTVDELSPENVFGLYEVADKYQVDELKADCLECAKNALSVDTFCDAVVLALTHDQKELMELAIDLLSDKMVEIMVTVKWQKFLKRNPTQANELLIKAATNIKKNYVKKSVK